MTWASARRDAERLLAALPPSIDVNGLPIGLAWYESQDALDLMQPANSWPLAYHQMVTRAALRLLSGRGAKVSLRAVSLGEYQQWLGERDNTPEMRAQFVAEVTK